MFGKLKAVAGAAALAGVIALSGATSANATVTITDGGTFDAQAGASRLVVTGALAPLECTTTEGYGNVQNGTFGTTDTVGQVVPVFDDCTAFDLEFIVDCGDPEDHENTDTMLNLNGVPSAGTTPGTITTIECSIEFPLLGCTALVSGSVDVSYTNPAPNGTLTVHAAGQNLTVTESDCPSGIIPENAEAHFGAPDPFDPAGVVDLDYELTSGGPVIS